MAFPIPSHLPRKKNQDVSTKLLSEISETSFKSLSQEVASKWVAELNIAIRQTKEQIHKRVHSDLPAFDQQLSSSKYVQERLQALETNVDQLSDTLSHPETGLVPKLIGTLSRHAALAQETTDAEVMHQAMSHLAHCKREMQNLASLVEDGKLPDAVALCASLEHTLATSPPPLPATQVLGDIQRRFRALKDRAEEQLHEAYSRGVIVSASEIIIRPTIQVRASETTLSLSEILSSLSPASLTMVANTLRRDLTTHYIDYLLTQPASLETSTVKHLTGTAELKLSLFPSPPNTEQLSTRIENARGLFAFLDENLFPHFPPSAKLLASLSKPITTALLEKLLVPSLPFSAAELPSFLELMQQAVKFEEDIIIGVLASGRGENDVASWANGVAGHYERKRRVELLEKARAIVLRDEDKSASFHVEVRLASQQTTSQPTPVAQLTHSAPVEEVAWGFEEDGESAPDEDGWGFGDEAPSEDAAAPEPAPEPEAAPAAPADEDPDDAWGWNEEEVVEDGAGDASTDSSPWDDPWGDATEPNPPVPAKAPKTATKLEKLSKKGKTIQNSPPIPSPVPTAPPPPTPAMPSSISQPSVVGAPRIVELESYVVSGRMKELLGLVEDILREASDLSTSGTLASFVTDPAQVGAVLSPTSASVLDLYRALYPVHADSSQSSSAKWSIQFSNNCAWLSREVKRVASGRSVPPVARSKLEECQERLASVAELWFEDAVDGQCQKTSETLDSAEGFVGTTHQDRYDDCEAAVNQVLRDTRQFSQSIKPLLQKSKHYKALGSVVDTALSRILRDILAIPDITAEESHKLSEICRIMNSLEGLFVEDSEHPSFIVDFVPSWFKFSYLSELLEASIADISYLFEEGALVDFKIDELVNLVRALFADTPLRTNTINKLMQGHPPVLAS